MGRIGISCLFPASWHFSISPVGCPRILNTNLRQIVVISILAAAVSLLYFSVVIIRSKYGWLSKDKKFQRGNSRLDSQQLTIGGENGLWAIMRWLNRHRNIWL
uniref:Ectonucleoside triphosphate diphosphohydrolase 4 n=1 Tax=Mus musculus TaxID=10090 RepID=Q80WR8_MOUSE|nr:Entpd4 protein [Mus musculus]